MIGDVDTASSSIGVKDLPGGPLGVFDLDTCGTGPGKSPMAEGVSGGAGRFTPAAGGAGIDGGLVRPDLVGVTFTGRSARPPGETSRWAAFVAAAGPSGEAGAWGGVRGRREAGAADFRTETGDGGRASKSIAWSKNGTPA